MDDGGLPKYFVASGPGEPLVTGAAEAVHAIDVFRTIPPNGKHSEWAVAAAPGGRLFAVPQDERARLTPAVRGELSEQELVGRIRELDASSFYLFGVESLDAAGDSSGVNDPLRLGGVLFGPFPSATPSRIPGHLVVTRGDVLEGLVRGAWHRFHYASESPRHCHHMMLAGEPDDEIAKGRGLVLAYPLIGEGMELGDAGNELPVIRFLHDVLQAMQADVLRSPHSKSKPFARTALPVPSRAEAVTAMEARGFQVDGGTASRARSGVLGKFVEEVAPVPDEGALRDFLRSAAVALDSIPDWPSPRARALRERLRLREIAWTPEESRGLRPFPQHPWRFEIHRKTGEIVSYPPSRFFGETWRRLNLAADPAFTLWNRGPMELEVEFRPASVAGHAWADYESAERACRGADGASRTPIRDGWARAVLQFGDAWLRGGLNGADVSVNFKTRRNVRVRKIVLRAKPPFASDRNEAAAALAVPRTAPAVASRPSAKAPASAPAGAPGETLVEWVGDALGSWTAMHQVSIATKEGVLSLDSLDRDPHIQSPSVTIEPPAAVRIRVRSQTAGEFELFWQRRDRSGYSGMDSTRFVVPHDGAWHEVEVPIFDVVPVTRLRLDPGRAAGHVDIAWIRVVRRAVEPDPVPSAARRVVYFDPRYPTSWIHGSARIAELAEKKGFEPLDARQLASWMRTRIADRAASLVVMAQDVAPESVLDSGRADCLLRRYLGAGGRMAWAGDVPFCSRGDATGRKDWFGAHQREGVFGFDLSATDEHPEKAVLTDDGAAWGLKHVERDASQRLVGVGDVTTVFARVGKYLASCWFKNFDPSRPSSGFVRYRTKLRTEDDAEIENFLQVALHGFDVA